MQWTWFGLSLVLLSGFSTFDSTSFATTPVVTVTSPANGSQGGSPVNFIASASSPDCPSGIAAMRIYTAPGDGAYTTDSDSLNINLTLPAGSYNTVVQTWDNCGGVGKTPVSITVTGNDPPAARFLFASSYADNRVYGYNVDPGTGAITPTDQRYVSTSAAPETIASDQCGYRLYVTNQGGNVTGYFINRDDGGLQQVPGAAGAIQGFPTNVVVHPSGDFVYVTVFTKPSTNSVYAFAVQTNGALVPVPGSPFATDWPDALQSGGVTVNAAAIDPTGNYLYAVAYGSPYVDAYRINRANGALTPVAGEPYSLVGDSFAKGGAQTLAFAQKGQHLVVPGWLDDQITVFNVNSSTGALTNAPYSPLRYPYAPYSYSPNLISIAIDPMGRWWYLYEAISGGELPGFGDVATFTAQNTVERSGEQCGDVVRADPSGRFVYAIGNTVGSAECNSAYGAILGFAVNQTDGALTPLPASPYSAPVLDGSISGDGLVVTP